MEGQRLIAISGTYGADATTYGTENEDFSTITSHAYTGITGTGWFEITTKDGAVIEYGHTDDSRILNYTDDRVLLWQVNRITYPDGNYIEYKYEDHSGPRISEINYTGNLAAGLLPYNKIKFEYGYRSDKTITYEAGIRIFQDKLLTKITVTGESDQPFKIYEFNYGTDDISSYLKEVKEYGTDGTALNATIFKYGDAPQELSSDLTNVVQGQSVDLITGDFDGDGYSDILAASYQYTNFIKYHTQLQIYRRTASDAGYYVDAIETLQAGSRLVEKQYSQKNFQFLTGDFTGDGADDILSAKLSSNGQDLNSLILYQFVNPSVPLTQTSITPYPGYSKIHSSGNFIFPGDYDGDGIQDILAMLGSSSTNWNCHLYNKRIQSNFGSIVISGSHYFEVSDWASADQVHVLDFNGDGRSDLMIIKDNHCEIVTFDNIWTVRRIYYSNSYISKNHLIYFGDFNGDRKTDILIRNSKTNNSIPWYKASSNGKDFEQEAFTFQHTPKITGTYSDDQMIIADLNGDGKTDIYHGWDYFVGSTASTSRLDVYYSKGVEFRYIQSTFSSTLGFERNVVLDRDGDGRADIFNVTSYTSPIDVLSFKKSGKENFLEKVKNGYNHVTEWAYKKLTDEGTFYSKGGNSDYPVNNIQPPMYVVSDFNTQNGIGGVSTIQYSYQEAKLHRAGKGFMGFRKVVSSNITTGIKTISEIEINTVFFTTAPLKNTTYLLSNNALLNETSFTNEFAERAPTGSKRFWYRVNSTLETNTFEGRTASVSNTYDDYGNVTLRNTNNNNVESSSTTTIFGAFGTPVPAKPTSITVTNTRAGQPAYTLVTSYNYNGIGQLSSKIDFSGSAKSITTTYAYNNLGNLTGVLVTPAGMTARNASSTFDPKGRYTITSSDALDYVTSSTFDPKWGKILTMTGVDGLVTSVEYDAFGRVKKTTYPEGYSVTQSFGWDISGNSVWYSQASHPGKPDVKVWYDLLGREVKSETEGFQSQAITQNKTYDSRGNIATSTQPYKSGESYLTTTNTYDVHNRLTGISNALGNTTISYAYASGNLITTTTDPSNRITSKILDASQQIISSSDNAGTLTYTYNSQGKVVTVNGGSPVITSSVFDEYGKQTSLTDMNAGTTSYVYNSYGELTGQTNSNAQTHSMTYDLLGRILTRVGPEGTTTYEYYDHNAGSQSNKIKKITGFSGDIEEYTYDTYARVSSIKKTVDGIPHISTYGYNIYGDVTSLSYPSGLVINSAYDSNGYPTTIKNTNNSITLYTNTGMNGLGQNTTYNLGNTKNSTNSYNYGIPVRYLTSGLQDLEMGWNYANGNLTQRKDNIKSKTEDFTYDNLDRLSTATVVGLTAQTVNYANSGNISSKSDAGSYSYHATKQNAVTGITNTANTIPLLQQDISYTSFQQPDKITENGYELQYTYGSNDNRIKSVTKQNGSTINTRYYFDGYEKDITDGTTLYIHYINSPAGLIGIVLGEGINPSDYKYVYTDHLGSILTVTNDAGTVEAEQSFDAWGRRRNPTTWLTLLPTAATGLPSWLYRGYTAHEHLDNFGLINMNGRMYDPVAARMLSPDSYIQLPYNTQSYNRYSYALNNPLKYNDPTGELFGIDDIAAGAIVGALIGGVSYTIGAALSGGGFKQNWSWKQFGKSLVSGAVSGALTAGIGAAVQGLDGAVQIGIQMAAHGVVGGFSSKFQGGDFASGFAGAAAGSLLGSVTGGEVLGIRVGASAIIGGIMDEAAGGNFWRGAAQSAIVVLLNHGMHPDTDPVIGEDGVDPRFTMQDPLRETKAFFGLMELTGIGTLARSIANGMKWALTKVGFRVVAREGSQFTKSSLQLGQQMHKAYKAGLADKVNTFKEFTLPSGKRIDFLDVKNGIIYELKPNNPRAILQGQKQLQIYMKELQSIPRYQGINWRTVLDTY